MKRLRNVRAIGWFARSRIERVGGLIRGEFRSLRDPEFVVHVRPETLIEPAPMSKRIDRYITRWLP